MAGTVRAIDNEGRTVGRFELEPGELAALRPPVRLYPRGVLVRARNWCAGAFDVCVLLVLIGSAM